MLFRSVGRFMGDCFAVQLGCWLFLIEVGLIEMMLSQGGWTFYGGLLCGAAGVLTFTYRKGLPWKSVLDAGAPGMMLSYGIGRFGCHFSGDGDWGIANLKQSSFLPDWAWAYKYPHNVVGRDGAMGMEYIPGSVDEYAYQLIQPVYPTPLYEALMALRCSWGADFYL